MAAILGGLALMFSSGAGSELRQTLYESTGDIRKKAYDAYGQASEQVNTYVSKGKQAVERGREAFDNARQSASGPSGTASSGSDFGQNRPGVTDFSTSRSGV